MNHSQIEPVGRGAEMRSGDSPSCAMQPRIDTAPAGPCSEAAMILESVTKAEHSLQFAADDLLAALKVAGPVESIILLNLARDSVSLRDRTEQLLQAIGGREVAR